MRNYKLIFIKNISPSFILIIPIPDRHFYILCRYIFPIITFHVNNFLLRIIIPSPQSNIIPGAVIDLGISISYHYIKLLIKVIKLSNKAVSSKCRFRTYQDYISCKSTEFIISYSVFSFRIP